MRVTKNKLERFAGVIFGNNYGTKKDQFFIQSRDTRVGGYELVQFMENGGEGVIASFPTGLEMRAFLSGLATARVGDIYNSLKKVA